MLMSAPKGNRYAAGNKGGQSPTYGTPEELAAQIEAYFTYCLGEFHQEEREETTGQGRKKKTTKVKVEVCDREPERPMITRLALFLGFSSRQSLFDYAKKLEFAYPIQRAKLVIESEYEDLLPYAKGNGVVFALKNFDWIDKKEVETRFKGRTVVRPEANGSIIIEEVEEPEP